MPRKRLSSELKKLFEALGKAEALDDMHHSRELLDEIALSEESAALIPLAPYLFSRNRIVAEASARIAGMLLIRLPASEYFWLDEDVRAITAEWRYHAEAGSPRLPANKVKLLFDSCEYSWASYGLASFHANGFVREEALHHLASTITGQELPFLLIRLRDWVSEVRRVAESAIRERLVERNVFHWVRCLPLVYRVRQGKRHDYSLIGEIVETLLLRQQGGLALIEGMLQEDCIVRRLSLRLAMDHDGIDHRALIIMGLKDRDTTLRRMAARMVRERMGDEDREHILPLMRANRSMAVRREAILMTLERNPEKARGVMEKALLDEHAAIRDCARFYLREAGWTDFPEFYREAVTHGEERYIGPAILGLGETGTEADGELVAPFTGTAQPSLRKAAIKALDRLWKRGGEDVFIEALRSEHAGVSRAAREALAKRLHFRVREDLGEIIQGHYPLHGRLNALYLMARADRWESLACLLDGARDRSSEIVMKSIQYLERWTRRFNRSFIRPDARQLEEISRSLEARSSAIGEELKKQIQYLVRGW